MSTTHHTGSHDERCESCRSAVIRKVTGEWPSEQARNRWALFGCTCEPGSTEDAMDFLGRVAD